MPSRHAHGDRRTVGSSAGARRAAKAAALLRSACRASTAPAASGEKDSESEPPSLRLLRHRCLPDVCRQSSLPAHLEEGSSIGSSDFESLSSCSSEKSLLSSTASESSEIPEAILEDSSAGEELVLTGVGTATYGQPGATVGALLPMMPVSRAAASLSTSEDATCLSTDTGAASRLATVSVAWAPSGAGSGGGAQEGPGVPSDAFSCRSGTAARSPVRRARVRGTVLLPTSAQGDSPPLLPRPSTAPLRRPWASGEGGSEPRLPRLAAERAILEEERELAAQRALASEEALAAERANHEAELARQAQETADRQAILEELNHDRTELASLCRAAHQELSRMRADLSERDMENLELRCSRDRLDRELQQLRSSARSGTCVVCLDAVATRACLPCGHLALCEACVEQLDRWQCPVCRHAVRDVVQIYTP